MRIRFLLLACILWTVPVAYPVRAQSSRTVRIATFNASLNQCLDGRENPCLAGGLTISLDNKQLRQPRQIAEVIQRVAPDIVLLNEFNYDAAAVAATRFQTNFLSVGQNVSQHPKGPAPAIEYPYRFLAPTNTGVHSGYDLNNDGRIDSTPGDAAYAGDAFGFGQFEGRYGMLLLSKFPIERKAVRTFQKFLWKDMPDAKLPDNPGVAGNRNWYSAEELSVLRLSSKSHWDVPIRIDDQLIHVLASHPTPPVFDGVEDRNGRRNDDEIRLWADYLTPEKASYLVDDGGKRGGLSRQESFVILGDLNADPTRGDQIHGAIQQLLQHARIRGENPPLSETGSPLTSTFGLRVDYVLVSRNLSSVRSGVFWPDEQAPLASLLEATDHRMVWVDVKIPVQNAENSH